MYEYLLGMLMMHAAAILLTSYCDRISHPCFVSHISNRLKISKYFLMKRRMLGVMALRIMMRLICPTMPFPASKVS
jgi:hypothetical protein